jgi:hypothetical protein
MGSSGFDPNFGWDFNAYGGIEVGTVGAASAPTDHSLGLDAAKTIGVSLADGSVAWRQPGQFQCGGALQFETPPLLCLYHGTLTGKPNLKATIPSFKGLNVTLQGVNPATGAITWNLSVQNGAALATGKVELVDDSHFLVDLANGKTAILDASTGQTAPVPKQQVFWCTSISFFKVNESKSVNPQRQRVAGNTFFPCTANGRATTKLPISSPSTIGTTIDGIFLWASPHGLGSRVVGAAHGVA